MLKNLRSALKHTSQAAYSCPKKHVYMYNNYETHRKLLNGTNILIIYTSRPYVMTKKLKHRKALIFVPWGKSHTRF